MPQWHGDRNKRKITGGKRKPYRRKRLFEKGTDTIETKLGGKIKKNYRSHGGIKKIKLLKDEYANVVNIATRKTEKARIVRVVKNPVNVDYDRRKIITKSTIIETPLGEARVTSRTGQKGLINAILIRKTSS